MATTRAERPATYEFGDSSKVGFLLGLGLRQAVPVLGGLLLWSVSLQAGLSWFSFVWPVVALVAAFGRIGGAPLFEVAGPGMGHLSRRVRGEKTWARRSLLGAGPGYEQELPPELEGLEMLEASGDDIRPDLVGIAVVRDRRAGTMTAVLRVSGQGFSLGSPQEQDGLVGAWGGALAPFAREKSPVSRVVWHEWAHPVGMQAHQAFLAEKGVSAGEQDAVTASYLELVDAHAQTAITHEVLLTVTVDQRRIRARRSTSPTAAAMEALCDEVGLFAERLGEHLVVEGVLTPAELSKVVRIWSDPSKVQQVETFARSLAAATGRGAIEWGPMAVDSAWKHVLVDGSFHRSYRVATWPQIPVLAGWLDPLLTSSQMTRTVTVVMEPVPISQATKEAGREVMAREGDAEEKERRGFRVNARERKRLAQVNAREQELAHGHPEFRFTGFVDVVAANLDRLDDAAAQVEQMAAQSLLDLRPLDARQAQGWVASLPLGRCVAPGVMDK